MFGTDFRDRQRRLLRKLLGMADVRNLLFAARTTDGNSSTATMTPGLKDYTLLVTGTFDGATVTLQASQDNSTWAAVGATTTVTAASHVNFYSAVQYFRAVVSSAGASTSLNVWIGS